MLAVLFAASEPSKVPFYFVGGALAAWAVILAGLGLTQPDFPYGQRGARGVMLVSLVLVVATIATAVLTSGFK